MTAPRDATPAGHPAEDELSAGAVDERLRLMAALSLAAPPFRHLVDMSAGAVTARLRECADVSALAATLLRAGAAAGLGPMPFT